MIRLLRYFFLPIAAFVVIAGLAWGEWSKILKLREAAETFLQTSEIRVFKDVGERQWQGRPFPTYEYDLGGETKEFATHRPIALPADRRVRMGPDPIPPRVPSFSEPQQRELVVPINGPDSVETVYAGMRGHEIGKDLTKATLVSVGALVAGVAGFFLQRIIFRDVRRAVRAR